jgi:hypothetical protein
LPTGGCIAAPRALSASATPQKQPEPLLIEIRGVKLAAPEPTAELIVQLPLASHRCRGVALPFKERCKCIGMGGQRALSCVLGLPSGVAAPF